MIYTFFLVLCKPLYSMPKFNQFHFNDTVYCWANFPSFSSHLRMYLADISNFSNQKCTTKLYVIMYELT